MHSSGQVIISPGSLKVLTNLAKILYDDVTYTILEYIINRPNQLIEEQEMANNLNLSYGTVRTSLTMLERHGILLQSEHIKRKSEEETQTNNTTFTDSISNPSVQRGDLQHTKRSTFSYRKAKTSDWKLNNTFYNGIKTRFEELKRQLKDNLDKRATLWFECPLCSKNYTEAEGSFNNLVCLACESKPALLEKGKEDVTYLKKKCNELISSINELFLENDKGGPEFHHQLVPNDFDGNAKSWNKNERIKPGMGSQKFEIIFENFEEPGIDKFHQEIKTDKMKNKMFHDIMEYYIHEQNTKTLKKLKSKS